MCYKSAGLLFLLFLCISCADTSHNILPATSSDNGILVIPHSAKGQHGSGEFFYGYILLYKPETQTQIEIIPHRAKEFIIIEDFPPGAYSIDEMVIFPNSRGANEFTEYCRPVSYGAAITESIVEEIKTLDNFDKWELEY